MFRGLKDDDPRVRPPNVCPNAHRLCETAGVLSITALLAGCWAVPRADVQPAGEPHTIQEDIVVVSTLDHQIVQSVDAQTHVLMIAGSTGGSATAYRVAGSVTDFERLQSGNQVRLEVRATLRVYVAPPALAPPPTQKHSSGVFEARVLMVDPSYRLITAVFGNGRTESFKVGLNVRLRAMQPGDAILMHPIEVTRIQRQRS